MPTRTASKKGSAPKKVRRPRPLVTGGGLNTIVHEAKHVQSHICKYYHVEEDSEQAAYLIGYIVQKMHDFFRYQISTGRE